MHLMNIIALFTNASIREMYMKFFSGCAHFCSCCYCSVVFGWRARIFNVYFYACGALFELVVLCCTLMPSFFLGYGCHCCKYLVTVAC